MKWSFTLLMLLLVAGGFAQPVTNNAYIKANYNAAAQMDGNIQARLDNLKGNIRQLSVFEYNANKDLSNGVMVPGTPTFTLLFDTGKRVTQEWSYWDAKQVAVKTFFRSYKNNNADSVLSYGNNGNLFSGAWYTYNADGIAVKEKVLYNGTITQQQFALTKAGDTVLLRNKLGVGKYLAKRLIEQNQQADGLSTRYAYAPDGSVQRKTYYEKGRIVRIEDFNAARYLVFIQYNNFNKSGTVTSKDARAITYNQDGAAADETRVHITQAGTMREVTTYIYQAGKLAQMKEGKVIVATYKYNDKSDLVEASTSDGKDTYAYAAYDANGNWLKKIHYHNSQPITITERQIAYY